MRRSFWRVESRPIRYWLDLLAIDVVDMLSALQEWTIMMVFDLIMRDHYASIPVYQVFGANLLIFDYRSTSELCWLRKLSLLTGLRSVFGKHGWILGRSLLLIGHLVALAPLQRVCLLTDPSSGRSLLSVDVRELLLPSLEVFILLIRTRPSIVLNWFRFRASARILKGSSCLEVLLLILPNNDIRISSVGIHGRILIITSEWSVIDDCLIALPIALAGPIGRISASTMDIELLLSFWGLTRVWLILHLDRFDGSKRVVRHSSLHEVSLLWEANFLLGKVFIEHESILESKFMPDFLSILFLIESNKDRDFTICFLQGFL